MPWNGTELYLAELGGDGARGEPALIAGGAAESIFQPEWSPDGARSISCPTGSGWWRSLSASTSRREAIGGAGADGGRVRRAAMAVRHVDLCVRRSPIASSAPTRKPGSEARADRHRSGRCEPIATPFTEFGSVRGRGRARRVRAGAPDHPQHRRARACVPPQLLTEGNRRPRSQPSPHRRLPRWSSHRNSPPRRAAPRSACTIRRAIPTSGPAARSRRCSSCATAGRPRRHRARSTSGSILDQPRHRRARRELPRQHRLRPAYRDRLQRSWGIVDVDDCVNGARFLAERGLVDHERVVIRGGSAGGYTTLAALAFRDTFQARRELLRRQRPRALARDTHKFESRYLDRLIGPYPREEDLYRERSPLHHAIGCRDR